MDARELLDRALTCAGVVLLVLFLSPSAGAAPPRTVVSFTVDDGTASQSTGARILSEHRMRGTFYVVSGSIGQPGYLGMDDLRRMAAAGHEIGGHTVNHPDLGTAGPDELRREICQDRANLTGWGFRVTSFAYPFGTADRSAQRAAQDCGYNSARITGSIRTARGCDNCPSAEVIPPPNPMAVRGTGMVDPSWTLDELKQLVRDAEADGGGWVPLVLHQTCDFCGSLSISPRVLDQFASWLATREANGTVVRTVDQVVGGESGPLVRPPAPEPRAGLVNASLEEPGPRGWTTSGSGRISPKWTLVPDARSGRWAQRLDLAGEVSGDAKLLQRMDMGEVAPLAHENNTYTLNTWYKSTAPTQFAVYYRDQSGFWRYWITSPFFAPANGWTAATWTTPAAPPGTTGISFGLALSAPGSLTTDDYGLREHPQVRHERLCDRLPWTPMLRWLC
ncbi:Polysaccharide deacetylase [Saccharopolyspora antimicrobica]|uniref:Polysaccharide deacetylase n=1 Tax=Saccharopolyspora antimicrobica TaxID=455193 RepID=A0A1I5HN35_9PSEU|nr:polysaccharide deacetylase family protein [Saccharopolyspora antimicrobica]RKT82426.1 polysaccharide deacetylase [Saccharopolyspora antimicrobica]SFO49728.1 Polysaccharide deacetylase [Saccharopolyspora antimicrobica]